MQEHLEKIIPKWSKIFSDLNSPFVPLKPGTYKIEFNQRMRSRAGVCSPSESLIQLNPHLMKTPEFLEEVLVHELCHLVISRRWPYAQSHGRKWQNLMEALGFNPRRCHEIEVDKRYQQRRWQAFCSCQTHMISTVLYNRLKKGIRYQCLTCNNQLLLGSVS